MDDDEFDEEDRQAAADEAIMLYTISLRRSYWGDEDPKQALALLRSRLGSLGIMGEEMDKAINRALSIVHYVNELQRPAPPECEE